MNFEVTHEQQERIEKWLFEEVYPEVIARQKEAVPNPDAITQSCWDDGYPYTGAVGGGLTYEFTPNSIGTTFIVRYHGGYSLDLTDYSSW